MLTFERNNISIDYRFFCEKEGVDVIYKKKNEEKTSDTNHSIFICIKTFLLGNFKLKV